MLFRTHIIITLFFALLFFQHIPNFILFLPVALFATILPDIDTPFSKIGRYKISRIFNFFVKHRGITHSLTFLGILSFLIFLFFKQILFAFVLGYSLHLLSDAITVGGIRPFYPLNIRMKGKIKTGGIFENLLFAILFFGSLFLIFALIYPIF